MRLRSPACIDRFPCIAGSGLPLAVRPLLALTLMMVSVSAAPAQLTEPITSSISADDSEALRNVQVTEIVFDKLEGRTSPPVITALAGSADGKFIAAAGDDHAIRIIESATGKTLQTVIGHNDWIQSLAFAYPKSNLDVLAGAPLTPDLYSAGHDGRVLRWKFSFPLVAQEVAIVPYAIRSISVSSDRQLLAIGGFSDEVLLYNLADDQYVQRLKCSTIDQRCVRFSPSGTRVLSGSRTGEIRVWDTATGELMAQYHEHSARIHTAAFSSSGDWVTSAGEDRRLVRYDIPKQGTVWNHRLETSRLMSLCLINDHLVAVAGADNGICLFDARTGCIVAEMAGHSGTVAVMAPCGESLASGSFDTTVRLWNLADLENKRSRRTFPTSTTPIKMDAQLQIR